MARIHRRQLRPRNPRRNKRIRKWAQFGFLYELHARLHPQKITIIILPLRSWKLYLWPFYFEVLDVEEAYIVYRQKQIQNRLTILWMGLYHDVDRKQMGRPPHHSGWKSNDNVFEIAYMAFGDDWWVEGVVEELSKKISR